MQNIFNNMQRYLLYIAKGKKENIFYDPTFINTCENIWGCVAESQGSVTENFISLFLFTISKHHPMNTCHL